MKSFLNWIVRARGLGERAGEPLVVTIMKLIKIAAYSLTPKRKTIKLAEGFSVFQENRENIPVQLISPSEPFIASFVKLFVCSVVGHCETLAETCGSFGQQAS